MKLTKLILIGLISLVGCSDTTTDRKATGLEMLNTIYPPGTMVEHRLTGKSDIIERHEVYIDNDNNLRHHTKFASSSYDVITNWNRTKVTFWSPHTYEGFSRWGIKD